MKRSFVIAGGIVAFSVYLLLDNLEPFFALHLREISSTLAACMLRGLGISVVQTGTILSTPNFRFDVVPACSGSTTLRVLLTASIIWCTIHPRLTLGRRALAVLFCIPCALLANALRVATLAGLGDIQLKPVEGIPHALVGLAAFCLAMGAIYLFTDYLQTTSGHTRTSPTDALWFGCLFTLLSLPVLIWLGTNAFLSVAGFMALTGFVLSVGMMLVAWKMASGSAPSRGIGLTMLWLFVLAFLLFGFLDVPSAQLLLLLFILAGVAYLSRGRTVLAPSSAALALATLTIPMVGNAIEVRVLGRLSLHQMWLTPALQCLGVFILLLWFYQRVHRFPSRVAEHSDVGWRQSSFGISVFIPLILSIGFQVFTNSKAATLDQNTHLELSYLQGDWVGQDNPVSEVAVAVIGRERITSRLYRRGEASVEMIVTSTGADRRRAHAPEGCMNGTGWTAVENHRETRRISQADVETSFFRFRRESDEVDFVYWFTDGVKSFATQNELLREDLIRRARGIHTNWFLYRVIAKSGTHYLDDFLTGLNSQIISAKLR